MLMYLKCTCFIKNDDINKNSIKDTLIIYIKVNVFKANINDSKKVNAA